MHTQLLRYLQNFCSTKIFYFHVSYLFIILKPHVTHYSLLIRKSKNQLSWLWLQLQKKTVKCEKKIPLKILTIFLVCMYTVQKKAVNLLTKKSPSLNEEQKKIIDIHWPLCIHCDHCDPFIEFKEKIKKSIQVS